MKTFNDYLEMARNYEIEKFWYIPQMDEEWEISADNEYQDHESSDDLLDFLKENIKTFKTMDTLMDDDGEYNSSEFNFLLNNMATNSSVINDLLNIGCARVSEVKAYAPYELKEINIETKDDKNFKKIRDHYAESVERFKPKINWDINNKVYVFEPETFLLANSINDNDNPKIGKSKIANIRQQLK